MPVLEKTAVNAVCSLEKTSINAEKIISATACYRDHMLKL